MGIIKNIGIRAVSKKHASFLRREMEISGEDKKEFLLDYIHGHLERETKLVKEKWHILFISIVWMHVCNELSYDKSLWESRKTKYLS